ncbi:MAG: phosphatidylglycerol lysyltransferase domain-containing protein, partial [bacterium]
MKSNRFPKYLIETWSVRLISFFVATSGIVNLLSAINPAMKWRMHILRQFVPLSVSQGARLTTIISGFALILLAVNLYRHKKNARLFALIVLAIAIFTHLLKGLDFEESFYLFIVALTLWFMGPYFQAKSDPILFKNGFKVIIIAIIFTYSYGTLGFLLLERHFNIQIDFFQALILTTKVFFEFESVNGFPVTRKGRFFLNSIYFTGITTSAYGFLMLFRPVFFHPSASIAEKKKASQIIQKFGKTIIAKFCLFDDKSYFFSAGGSVLAYVLKGRISLVLGDPIGPVADFSNTVSQFTHLCKHNDWKPVFYQVLPDNLTKFQTLGFGSIKLGSDAIVDPSQFTLEGHSNKKMRSAVNRLKNMGYNAEYLAPPQSRITIEKLRYISDKWLNLHHGKEDRFSLGSFDDDYIRASSVFIVRNPEAEIIGFVSLVENANNFEVGVDLMRHANINENGVMEFLFTSLIYWAKDQKYKFVNLGLSALANIGDEADDPLAEKALNFIYNNA